MSIILGSPPSLSCGASWAVEWERASSNEWKSYANLFPKKRAKARNLKKQIGYLCSKDLLWNCNNFLCFKFLLFLVLLPHRAINFIRMSLRWEGKCCRSNLKLLLRSLSLGSKIYHPRMGNERGRKHLKTWFVYGCNYFVFLFISTQQEEDFQGNVGVLNLGWMLTRDFSMWSGWICVKIWMLQLCKGSRPQTTRKSTSVFMNSETSNNFNICPIKYFTTISNSWVIWLGR